MAVATATTVQEGPSGLDLKLHRTALRVSQIAIARHIGVSHSRIEALESAPQPTLESAIRYLAALHEVAAAAT